MWKSYIYIYNKYVIIVRISNKHWKTKPKVHTKYVRLSFLLTSPSWIAVVNNSKPSVKRFGRRTVSWNRINKLTTLNRKILNWFRFGLAIQLPPKLPPWVWWSTFLEQILKCPLNDPAFSSHNYKQRQELLQCRCGKNSAFQKCGRVQCSLGNSVPAYVGHLTISCATSSSLNQFFIFC